MKKLICLCAMLGMVALLPATASAYWWDDFEGYAAGSQIVGQGGWEEWAAGSGALVSTAYAQSPVNSVEVVGATDLVHTYAGYTKDKWVYTAYQYIPSTLTGLTYFIMLNTYDGGSATYDWSVQVGFDGSKGLTAANCGSSNLVEIPYLTDQWVEIKVLIHLDEDWCQIYYGGTLLDDPAVPDHPTLGGGYAWTEGVFGGGTTGILNIGAVDLFANSAEAVYYDDMSLEPFGVWSDDFENYVAGTQIVGQGGWEEWAAGAGALVSNAYAMGGVNSVEIVGATDLVHTYKGFTTDKWEYVAYQYIPSTLTGLTYFIMLNTYDGGSATYDWSVQVGFDGSKGLTAANCGSSNLVEIPYLTDQWVEIKVLIHLDEDWCQIYYGGTLLDDPAVPDHPTLGGGYAWTEGVFGGGTTGILNIGAVDLFANSAEAVYYDDMSLMPYVMTDTLTCDVTSLPDATGGTANFTLDASVDNANRNYLIFGGVTGTSPGTVLPKGLVTLPINWDIFTNIVIGYAGTAIFPGFLGTLDANGQATAQFILPAGSGAAGLTMSFAYACNKPWDFVSNPVSIDIK